MHRWQARAVAPAPATSTLQIRGSCEHENPPGSHLDIIPELLRELPPLLTTGCHPSILAAWLPEPRFPTPSHLTASDCRDSCRWSGGSLRYKGQLAAANCSGLSADCSWTDP